MQRMMPPVRLAASLAALALSASPALAHEGDKRGEVKFSVNCSSQKEFDRAVAMLHWLSFAPADQRSAPSRPMSPPAAWRGGASSWATATAPCCGKPALSPA